MKLNKLRFLGVMIFVTVLMDVVPSSGFISIGHISITTMHIPTVLTAIALGPLWGMITGAVFGMISLLHAFSRESLPMDLLFMNPLVSVVPRICIALASGWVYRWASSLFSDSLQPAAAGAAAVTGTAANTLLVLGFLYFIYPEAMGNILHPEAGEGLLWAMVHHFQSNFYIEALLCLATVVPAMILLKKICKKSEE